MQKFTIAILFIFISSFSVSQLAAKRGTIRVSKRLPVIKFCGYNLNPGGRTIIHGSPQCRSFYFSDSTFEMVHFTFQNSHYDYTNRITEEDVKKYLTKRSGQFWLTNIRILDLVSNNVINYPNMLINWVD